MTVIIEINSHKGPAGDLQMPRPLDFERHPFGAHGYIAAEHTEHAAPNVELD